MTSEPHRPGYPYEEFARHYEELHEPGRLEPGEGIANMMAIAHYMVDRYPSETHGFEAAQKARWFIEIGLYLARHAQDFDQGHYGVYGSERVGGLVHDSVLKAVHRLATADRLVDLGDVPVAKVLALADEIRAQEGE